MKKIIFLFVFMSVTMGLIGAPGVGVFKVYPKITNNIVYIDGIEKDEATIILINAEGKEYKVQTIDIKGDKAIDLSGLPNGVYSVRIGSEVIDKVVKH